MRPRLIVSVVPDCNSNGIDADCSKCDFNVDNCYSRTEDELSTPAERIAALTFALKELGVDVPQWQPIETAPKDGTEIVLLGTAENSGPMLRSCISRWWDKKEGSPGYFLGWCYLAPGYCDKFVPTHWMPLPKPPKED